jgi:hypothetical protein
MLKWSRLRNPACLAFLACAGLRFLATVPFVIDDDEAWWSVSARWLTHPWDFYFQVPDDKTPGSVWFCWVVRKIFGEIGSDPRIVRAVYIGLTLLVALVVGKIAQFFFSASRSSEKKRAPSSSVFWIAALFFLFISTLPSPKLLAFTGDGLMTLFVVCGYGLALLNTSWIAFLFSGALLGFALLIKQTAVFAAFPILFSRWPRKWTFQEIAWILVGSLAVCLPSVIAMGPTEMLYWVWTYPKEVLTEVRGATFQSSTTLFSHSAIFLIALLPLSLRLFHSGIRFCRSHFDSRLWFSSQSPLLDFRFQWLVSAIAVIFVGKGLFLHYYLMAAPPLALLLVQTCPKPGFRLWEKSWLGIIYTSCCVLVTIPALQVSWGTDLPYFARLQKAIAPVLTPGQSVLVWGGSPIPLAYSGARPVTRFILPRYAVEPYGTERTKEIFQSELKNDPPSVVIDLHERGDNRFGNSLDSEPMIAELARDYHLYVAPGVPWAKFYFRTPPSDPSQMAQLVRIRDAQMKERVYSSYPSTNPAWKPFEGLIRRKPSFSALAELRKLDADLRTEHALELIALQSLDAKTRRQAKKLIQKLRDAEIEETRKSAEKESALFLAKSRDRFELLPLNTPEWWFSVSLTQMQPRIIPRSEHAPVLQ